MVKKKKSEGPNKSAMIRDFKAANPDAQPAHIAEQLGIRGITVSAQFVSTVLSNAKKKGGKIGKRGPKPGKKKAAGKSVVKTAVVAVNYLDLSGVFELAAQLKEKCDTLGLQPENVLKAVTVLQS